MPTKLNNYYKKQPILVFAPYDFLNFLCTQLHEPKISEKTISEYFVNGVLVFSEVLLFQRVRYTKYRGGYYKFRLSEAKFLIKSLVLAFSKYY